MATQDQDPVLPDAKKNKTRRTREHVSGVLVPHWWRNNVAFVVGLIAVASVAFAAFTLNQASERIAENLNADTQTAEQSTEDDKPETWRKSDEPSPVLPLEAVAHLFPDADEMAENEPVRAYEEALPDDLYEEAPVILDATGPRVTIPEEYIPDTYSQTAPQDAQTTPSDRSDDLAEQPEPEDIQDQLARLQDQDILEQVSGDADLEIKDFEQALLGPEVAWLANAIPFSPEDSSRPMIAIVIDDMGVDLRRSPRAIALPGPLTLSFLTYARDLEAQTRAAVDAGHELMIHIPMEPSSEAVDPGPNVLRVSDSPEQTLEHLRWGLSQFDGYVGLNNHMGSKFTQDSAGIRTVLEEVRDRGLLFLDSRTAGGSVAASLAREIGIPFATRNVFLDHVADEDEVRMRLEQTERLARKNGAAVAIGHPHDVTLKVLEEWIPTVAGKGLMLVPMSALVKRTWLASQ